MMDLGLDGWVDWKEWSSTTVGQWILSDDIDSSPSSYTCVGEFW